MYIHIMYEVYGLLMVSAVLIPLLCVQDVTICAACAPPGGGRNPVTPRFLRHFAIFSLPRPSEVSLASIFTVRVAVECTPFIQSDARYYCIALLFNPDHH